MNIKEVILSKYFLWILITIPGLFLLMDALGEYPYARQVFKELMHESGEMAARMMIIALMISPFRLIFPDNKFIHWLARNRRAFGVAAFCFAALHISVYLLFKSFPAILNDFNQIRIWLGWLAFLIFLPLAATSSNWAVQKLGGVRWKKLHKLVYVAAVSVAGHWLLASGGLGPTIVHFTPLVLLEAYRFYYHIIQRRKLA